LLARDADFGDPGLGGDRLDPGDQCAELALEVVERHQKIGPEGDDT
jgi:hypothetical protein